MENKLDFANSVPADIEFRLNSYKPNILNAIIKIGDSKKRPELDSIFHDVSKNGASNIDKDTAQFLISKLIHSNAVTVNKAKQG